MTPGIHKACPADRQLPLQLPAKERRKMFAHAGILLAAQAVLDDLKATGLLPLRHPVFKDTYRRLHEQRILCL